MNTAPPSAHPASVCSASVCPPLIPLALKDAPALMESVFPAQKLSIEALAERKAGSAQTLTGLGSYWKGRKPLILVRALLLGSLLPPMADPAADLALLEKLLAFDPESLARRALAADSLSVPRLKELLTLSPEEEQTYFLGRSWRRGLGQQQKLELYRRALATFASYGEQAALGKRPEEVDQDWLYAPVWPAVNAHYAPLGLRVSSMEQLVEQLGILRYGQRARVGDPFCGAGSIPFEAARLGCQVYASDSSPVACMLTWGALNVVGAAPAQRAALDKEQQAVFARVEHEITCLGVEHDEAGNRAKIYFYCLETRCPQSGWLVPLAPSWVISTKLRTIAQLIPNPEQQRFDIVIRSEASPAEMDAAACGTVQNGHMVYSLEGKTYRQPISTLRGDFKDAQGKSQNRLRQWEKGDFYPRADDVWQERLYAIQWISRDTFSSPQQQTFYAGVSAADEAREAQVQSLVASQLARWQQQGWVPDMAIEPGEKTDEPIRTRGWRYWHQLFNARQLLLQVLLQQAWAGSAWAPLGWLNLAKAADLNAKLSCWNSGRDSSVHVFSNQALNPFYNYPVRSWAGGDWLSHIQACNGSPPAAVCCVQSLPAAELAQQCDLWITDPPYADAVNYHEISEFFIAWLRKNPPPPFDTWVWDSRRSLAIKGRGDDFRRGMVAAYQAIVAHMPANGLQCVMFTHQDTAVWADMVGIFWAAGLQVLAAWYIASEATNLKKGGYVQGTVTLVLKQRLPGSRTAFKQQLLPAVRREVQHQIEAMRQLNDQVKQAQGQPVFNDSDLQMAGYAAALKVLTSYTNIGHEDVTTLALRPRAKGEVTLVDEIVQQAAATVTNLLLPQGLDSATWAKLSGSERFLLRMMEMEAEGECTLGDYQNFAKAFQVENYAQLMGSKKAKQARLKRLGEFSARELGDSSTWGGGSMGELLLGMQQVLAEVAPQSVVKQWCSQSGFWESIPLLSDLLAFFQRCAPEAEVRNAAELLGGQLQNQRWGA